MTREERLWRRMWDIRDGPAHGLWVPIMQHLAMRREPEVMVQFADWYSGRDGTDLGAAADPFSAAGLYRRAWRNEVARGAYNLAISFLNRGDLSGYRHWLRRAGRAGNAAAARQAKRFELRLPHTAAKRVRRWRPEAPRDDDSE